MKFSSAHLAFFAVFTAGLLCSPVATAAPDIQDPGNGIEMVDRATSGISAEHAWFGLETVIFPLNDALTPGTKLMVTEDTYPGGIEGTMDNLADGTEVDLSLGRRTYPFIVWHYGEGNDLVPLGQLQLRPHEKALQTNDLKQFHT